VEEEALTNKDLVEQEHEVEEGVYTHYQADSLEGDQVGGDVAVVDHQDVLLL